MNYKDAMDRIENRFIEKWREQRTGTINVSGGNRLSSSDAGVFDGFFSGRYIATESGFGTNTGRLFRAVSGGESSVTVSVKNLDAVIGDGDEVLSAYYTPFAVKRPDTGEKWKIGSAHKDEPYAILDFIGSAEEAAYTAGAPESEAVSEAEGVIHLTLHTPEKYKSPADRNINFLDIGPAALKSWHPQGESLWVDSRIKIFDSSASGGGWCSWTMVFNYRFFI